MRLGKIRSCALGMTPAQMQASAQSAGRPFIYGFVAELLMAWLLAGVPGHLGAGGGHVDKRHRGRRIGLVITTMATNHAFAGRDPRLLLMDGGYWPCCWYRWAALSAQLEV